MRGGVDVKHAHPLSKVLFGTFASDTGRAGVPTMVRYSTALQALRRVDTPAAAIAEFENDKATAARCPEHGALEDPVVGLLGDRVAFACPWCSGADVLAAWEREGNAS